LDAIASGEIQLAYIPDSPTEDDGDDPFDTSGVADVVKRIEEAEKKAKRQVNLGSAVDVLSGRAGVTTESRPRPKAGESTNNNKGRARPRAVNLLGDGDGSPAVGPHESTGSSTEPPTKDILDDILSSSPAKELDPPLLDKLDLLAQSVIVNVVPSEKKVTEDALGEENSSFTKELIGEFDLIGSSHDPIVEDPNFKKIPTTAILAALLQPELEEDDLDDEFAALAAESIHSKGHPPNKEEEGAAEEEDEDPFDTTFVEKVAPPGKFELKLIESEVLGKSDLDDDDDFDFNPRVGEALAPGSVCPNPSPRSLLEDHSPSGEEHPPALLPSRTPATGELIEAPPPAAPGLEVDDPFDTSKVETILPGKTELKFLEEELLKAVENKPAKPTTRPVLPVILSAPVPPRPLVDEDDDFDPRKDEPKPETVSKTDLLFELPHEEIAGSDCKVLTPQLEEKEVEFDPFDTSIASAVILVPGQLELRLLESELVSTVDPLEHYPSVQFPVQLAEDGLIDPEFDPRGGEEPDPFIVPANQTLKTEDIFDHHEEVQGKLLTPQQELPNKPISAASLESDFDDPFDTSAIEVSKLLPQSELRVIEGELLKASSDPPLPKIVNPLTLPQKVPTVPVPTEEESQRGREPDPPPPPPTPPPTSLFDVHDPFELELSHKPLTPAEVPSSLLTSDPFDTSIAEGIVPGKVEIKVLEEELGVGKPQTIDSLSDPDFNPRSGPQPIHPSALSFVSKTLEPIRVTSASSTEIPEDVDPFDTSAADNLGPTSVPSGPGKSELKALEAELL